MIPLVPDLVWPCGTRRAWVPLLVGWIGRSENDRVPTVASSGWPFSPEHAVTASVAREDRAAGGLLTVTLSCPVGDEVRVLQVAGEVDLSTLGLLREHVEEQVTAGHRCVVLDLTGVSFLAACGAALLAETADRAHALGVALLLVTEARAVLRVLELTGLNGAIRRACSVAEAVERSST